MQTGTQSYVRGRECSPCIVDFSVTAVITVSGKLLLPRGKQRGPDDAEEETLMKLGLCFSLSFFYGGQ